MERSRTKQIRYLTPDELRARAKKCIECHREFQAGRSLMAITRAKFCSHNCSCRHNNRLRRKVA